MKINSIKAHRELAPISKDNLVDDLLTILNDCGVIEDKQLDLPADRLLVEKLTIYIVQRDHKVFNHVYQIEKKPDVKNADL